MIRNIGFIMFMFVGCAAENPNDYSGGTIWYSPDDELPQAQPVCMEQEVQLNGMLMPVLTILMRFVVSG